MEINILYENSDFLVINKPSGIMVHGDGRTKEKTVVDWFISRYPESKGIGEPARDNKGNPIERSGVIHRLDKETSGALILVKTKEGFESIKSQFKNHQVKKEYHAFLIGELKEDKGVINRPIGRSSSDFRKWSAQRGARGELREAITEYEVIFKKSGVSFVKVFPKTGRTHQIRVHFKAINYPLVADNLYGPSKQNELGFQRTALHAYSIGFNNLDGHGVVVSAPYPEDFIVALDKLQSK